MAGSASNVVENRIINGFFLGQSVVVPTQLYVALFQGPPGEDGAVNEVSSTIDTWYARQDLAQGGLVGTAFAVPTTGTTSNLKVVNFPAATSSVTITHCGIFDAVTGGNMLAYSDLAQPKTYEVNDIASFPIGSITISAD